MAIFLIHYDLPQKPDVEHADLIPILTRIGAKRLTATAWAVRTEMELTAIRDELQLCILPGEGRIYDCLKYLLKKSIVRFHESSAAALLYRGPSVSLWNACCAPS